MCRSTGICVVHLPVRAFQLWLIDVFASRAAFTFGTNPLTCTFASKMHFAIDSYNGKSAAIAMCRSTGICVVHLPVRAFQLWLIDVFWLIDVCKRMRYHIVRLEMIRAHPPLQQKLSIACLFHRPTGSGATAILGSVLRLDPLVLVHTKNATSTKSLPLAIHTQLVFEMELVVLEIAVVQVTGSAPPTDVDVGCVGALLLTPRLCVWKTQSCPRTIHLESHRQVHQAPLLHIEAIDGHYTWIFPTCGNPWAYEDFGQVNDIVSWHDRARAAAFLHRMDVLVHLLFALAIVSSDTLIITASKPPLFAFALRCARRRCASLWSATVTTASTFAELFLSGTLLFKMLPLATENIVRL